jgi:hypothetical protein
MDAIRSSYDTSMLLWRDDSTTFPVRWFFAPEGAEVLPVPTVFCSSNWDSDEEQSPLGEQYPRVRQYDRGQNFEGYTGRNFCGPLDAFEHGGVHGLTPPITTDAEGYSPCCGRANLLYQLQAGLSLRPWQWKAPRVRSGFNLRSDQGTDVVQRYAGVLSWSAASSSTSAWSSSYAGLMAWSAASTSTSAWSSSYAGLMAWSATTTGTTLTGQRYAGLLEWSAASSSTSAWSSSYAGLMAWSATTTGTTLTGQRYAGHLAWQATTTGTEVFVANVFGSWDHTGSLLGTSQGISSVSVLSTGVYQVNFSTAYADTNYTAVYTSGINTASTLYLCGSIDAKATGSIIVVSFDTATLVNGASDFNSLFITGS